MNSIEEHFDNLSESIEVFISEVNSKKLTQMTGPEWSVKDQLCHIVFWHENYARNYKAMAEHKAPVLPEGMATINRRGVSSLRKFSKTKLIERLLEANKLLYKSIVVLKVPQMTYSKGGRVYKTPDFLEMVARHIQTHSIQVRRAK